MSEQPDTTHDEQRWEEWARRLAPLVHDGLIDTPQEQQIADKAFYLARLLDEHLSEAAARDPEANNAECGCGAISVARHTNAEHYQTAHDPEAMLREGARQERHRILQAMESLYAVSTPHDGTMDWDDVMAALAKTSGPDGPEASQPAEEPTDD